MGSFNVIFYGPKGREKVVYSVSLREAISRAEAYSRSGQAFAAASVRKRDGSAVGLASCLHPGEFIFEPKPKEATTS